MTLIIYIFFGAAIISVIGVFLTRRMSHNKRKAEATGKRMELQNKISKTVDRINAHKKKLSKFESLLPKHVKDPNLEDTIIKEASLVDYEEVISDLNRFRKDVELKRKKYNILVIQKYLDEVEKINALLDKSFEIMDNWFLYKFH